MLLLRAAGIFCEQVRAEIDHKHILIGVMPDNLWAPDQLPDFVEALGLFMQIQLAVDVPVQPLSIVLVLPDGSEKLIHEPPLEELQRERDAGARQGLPYFGLTVAFGFKRFPLPCLGVLKAVVRVAGEERICAMVNFRPRVDTVALSSVVPSPVDQSSSSQQTTEKGRLPSRPSSRPASPKRRR